MEYTTRQLFNGTEQTQMTNTDRLAVGFSTATNAKWIKWENIVAELTELFASSADLANKVDKVTGKSLVSDTEILKIHTQNTDWQLKRPDGTAVLLDCRNDNTIHLSADLYWTGSAFVTHAEQIYTSKNYIILRDGATTGLGIGEKTGLQALLYDGVNTGQLVFDSAGWARVGDVGSEAKLAAIEETTTDGYIMAYDAANFRMKGIATSDIFGFTPENVANKATTLATINDTLYPSIKLIDDNFVRLLGRAGGQTIIGGTAVDNVLTLQGNSANGNTATNKAFRVLVGENGATEAFFVLNNGTFGAGSSTGGNSGFVFTKVGTTHQTLTFRYNSVNRILLTTFGAGSYLDGTFAIGINSAAVRKFQVHEATAATTVYQKFTNATTGALVTDGTDIGLLADGTFIVDQLLATRGIEWRRGGVAYYKLDASNNTTIGGVTNALYVTAAGRLAYNGSARKVWAKYTANSVTLTNGTSASTVAALQTMTDGQFYTVTEASGAPGINLIVDFINVLAFEKVRVLGGYVGTGTHAVAIQLYNWVTTNWDTFNALQNSYIDTATANGIILNNEEFTVYDDTNYIGTAGNVGKVRVRMYHTMSGNASHLMSLDEVSLRQ